MSFRAGRFRCWACNASGDSIDFTGRLLGLEPLAAVERLNADFSLSLPLHRQPTPEERREDRRHRELTQAYRAFEAWRTRTIVQLNRAYRVGHEALKTAADMTEQEAEAVRFMAEAEYIADILECGTLGEQLDVFRERSGIELRIQKVLTNRPLERSRTA